MTELKPVNPDIRGYSDQFVCVKCGAYIWTPYNYYIDYQFCPYCGEKVKEDND
jgi:DNA-directed RNA polymerase subunit RPC12/RpoP